MSATLEVDLSALRANYHRLRTRHAKHAVAAVVKADAYGLGVAMVSRTLWDEGCQEFFVATLEEGITLRAALPDARIGVFSGVQAGEEKAFALHALMPVLNSPEMVARWKGAGHKAQVVHVDTGMTRLGLTTTQTRELAPALAGDSPLVISHLACANTPQHEKNAEQLSRFAEALAFFPSSRASLANSAGVFLPSEFHFDVARPGCALYGINPAEGDNPMQHVATLSAPVIQMRTLDRDETVGYGATYAAPKGSHIAVVALGYADGFFRSLGGVAFAYLAGVRVPVVGRVSMDMVALDASALSEAQLAAATRAQFINAQQTVDAVADMAGTIGYEVFTRIGNRVQRLYR
jgi:alanine racemase